jgi:hypothetical protein
MLCIFANRDQQVRFRTEISVCFPRHSVILPMLSDDSWGAAQRLEADVAQFMFGLV